MRKFSNLFLSSACALALLSGCVGKDGDPGPAGAQGPAGPAGQNLTGTMYGFVNPVDEYGSPLSKSGVTVTLDGVTPAATATTNADGRYEFAALRTGTYNLSFSRTGLITTRRLGVGHVGGDQPLFLGTNTITAPSTTSFGSMVVNSVTATNVILSVSATNTGIPAGSFIRTLVFASSSPGVTAANGVSLSSGIGTTSGSNLLQINLSKNTLNSSGFASGSPVYVVVYGAPSFLTSFADPLTGKAVFSGLSTPSNQVAFIAP